MRFWAASASGGREDQKVGEILVPSPVELGGRGLQDVRGDDTGPVIERREVAQSEEDLAVVDGPAQVRPFKGVEEAPEALVFSRRAVTWASHRGGPMKTPRRKQTSLSTRKPAEAARAAARSASSRALARRAER